jgi:LDH2 family malate/lactate/ureidoglycolate dehydrogenase
VMAAEQGFMGLIFCNGSPPGGIVTPFGGTGRALGANPIAWAVPQEGGKPLFLDIATSIVANGKIMVAVDKGEEIPLGWVIDKEGHPTTDPRDMAAGGALLPLGGHKGYALSVMIELLGGGLSGAGFPLMPGYAWDQGTVLMAVRIDAFQPLDEFKRGVREFAERMKTVRRAPGCEEILLPGEPEWRCREKREKEGIPVPEATWNRIKEAAKGLGLNWE